METSSVGRENTRDTRKRTLKQTNEKKKKRKTIFQ